MDKRYQLIPSRFRVLSGSALKLIAVVTMLIDHVAGHLMPNDKTVVLSVLGKTLTRYTLLRSIGRLAFPIYAFLLVEGFLHTRSRKRYGGRLAVFALLSELPWNLLHGGKWTCASQNVMFTLLLGFLGLYVLERLERGAGKRWALALVGLLAVSVLLRADYGCSGFGFILMLYLLRARPLYQSVLGACFLSARWIAGLAFIPISLYNGRRGMIQSRLVSLLFYAFYPVHMLVLYFIKYHVFDGLL
ncbi:MAG: TraX protein [Oscillospiraceae bacterium]|nr:TraX protein [Oscillospiraceae bacterium]